jgi:hypothetical protein
VRVYLLTDAGERDFPAPCKAIESVEQREEFLTKKLVFIFRLSPNADRSRCRGIRTDRLKIPFPQIGNRLITGSCEYHLDLASECGRLTPVADCDPVDRGGLLWSTRHCPASKFGLLLQDTIEGGPGYQWLRRIDNN